jgi:HAD superfamily hydrolase (TIGR01509 family)
MPKTTSRFDAVLFDMDGVLVDSEHRWNDVRIAYAAAHGCPWTLDDQHAVMGANSIQWATIMRDRLGLDGVPVERILADVVAGVVDQFRQGAVPVIPGAPAAVRRIAARWPVAIASSSHRDVIAAALDLLGLRDVLGAVTSSDEVAHGKPEPGVYLLAAERLGVAPERCLVVEDSTNGILAGKAAGAYVVLIPNPTMLPAPHAASAADAIVERIGDLDPDALPG